MSAICSCDQIEIAKLRREEKEMELNKMRRQITRDSLYNVNTRHELDSVWALNK